MVNCWRQCGPHHLVHWDATGGGLVGESLRRALHCTLRFALPQGVNEALCAAWGCWKEIHGPFSEKQQWDENKIMEMLQVLLHKGIQDFSTCWTSVVFILEHLWEQRARFSGSFCPRHCQKCWLSIPHSRLVSYNTRKLLSLSFYHPHWALVQRRKCVFVSSCTSADKCQTKQRFRAKRMAATQQKQQNINWWRKLETRSVCVKHERRRCPQSSRGRRFKLLILPRIEEKEQVRKITRFAEHLAI